MTLEEIETFAKLNQVWPSDGDNALIQGILPKLIAVAKAAKELCQDEFSANYKPLMDALEQLEK